MTEEVTNVKIHVIDTLKTLCASAPLEHDDTDACVQFYNTCREHLPSVLKLLDELADYYEAHEALGWKADGTHACGEHLSDAQVASKVRMLMRDDLDHEMVCVMARDRIRSLSRERDELKARVEAFERSQSAGATTT